MTRQVSFSKIRNEMMRGFRDRMNLSESTEDVRKFYAEAMQALFSQLIGRDEPVNYGDVRLEPNSDSGYEIAESIRRRPLFTSAWNESDLPNIVEDFSQVALNRFRHLAGNPSRTRAKIHHTDGKR